MAKKTPNKKCSYTQQDLENAIEDVNNGMSYYKASQIYKIPKTTLLYKRTGKTPMVCKMGPDTYLTKSEEAMLVQWIFYISDRGFPATKEFLLDSVQLLVKNLKRETPFVDGRPGRHWYEAFLKRHPELTRRVAQNLSKARNSITEAHIRRWFTEVATFFKEENLCEVFNDPSRIYNCDETALYLSPKENKVLVRKGEKAVYTFISNDEKECITTLIMCNGEGFLPPPMILYKYKRIPSNIAKNVPKEWGLGYTDNGWMTGASFYEYITNIFFPWLTKSNVKLPVILFLDGHSSHMTLALSEFCSKNQIILISLVANATHILQPLDVAFFRPFKNHWKKIVYAWRIENHGKKLSREEFPILLFKAFSTIPNSREIIQNGFRSCGLCPFTPNGINYEKYFRSSEKDNVNLNPIAAEKNNNNYKRLLDFFHDEFPDKVSLFETYEESYIGDIKDTNLYYFWKRLKEKSQDKSNPTELNHINQENAEPNSIHLIDPSIQNLELIDSRDLFIDIDERDLELYKTSTPMKQKTVSTSPIIITVPATNEEPYNNNFCLKTDISIPNLLVADKNYDEGININNNNDKSKININDTVNNQAAFDTNPDISTTIESKNTNKALKDNSNILEITPPDMLMKNGTTPSTFNPQMFSPQKSIGENIPTPFKKSLFWPTKENAPKIAKRKEKLPSVVSSGKWQQYFRKKEMDKELKERKKEENRKQRECRKNSVQRKISKNKKVQDKEAESSLGKKQEENVKKKDDNKYVIVKYEDKFYPGIVMEINKGKKELKIKTMQQSGFNWKWPNPDDILWYKETDIIQYINLPMLVNKRGSYFVKEISKYVD